MEPNRKLHSVVRSIDGLRSRLEGVRSRVETRRDEARVAAATWFLAHPGAKPTIIAGVCLLLLLAGGWVAAGGVARSSDSFTGDARIVSNGRTFTGDIVTVTTAGQRRVLVRYRTTAGKVRYTSTTAPGVTLQGDASTIVLAITKNGQTVVMPGQNATITTPGQTQIVTQTGPTVTDLVTVTQRETVTETTSVVTTVTDVQTVTETVPVQPPVTP
jgi:hypothetical protein